MTTAPPRRATEAGERGGLALRLRGGGDSPEGRVQMELDTIDEEAALNAVREAEMAEEAAALEEMEDAMHWLWDEEMEEGVPQGRQQEHTDGTDGEGNTNRAGAASAPTRAEASDEHHGEGERRRPVQASSPPAYVEEPTPPPQRASTQWVSAAFWNTGNLHAGRGQPDAGGWSSAEEARRVTAAAERKLSFLSDQLLVERPTVLFLFEVGGTRKVWPQLHRWLQERGYIGVPPLNGGKGKNAVVAAIDKHQGSLIARVALAKRVLGVSVRCKADGKVRRFVGMHGINTETARKDLDRDDVPLRTCFAQQLLAGEEYLRTTGGLMVGDFNRVPAPHWRAGKHRLTPDDRRVRKLAGLPTDDTQGGAVGRNMVAAFTGDEWSRWETSEGVQGAPTARIDYGLQLHGECGWKEHIREPPLVAGPAEERHVASDHAYIVVHKEVADRSLRDDRRPTPFQVGLRAGNPALRAAYLERTALSAGFGEHMETKAAQAEGQGGSATAATVRALVHAATCAKQETQAKREADEVRKGKMETPKQRFEGWLKRLKAACALRDNGGSPQNLGGTPLQGSKAVARVAKRRAHPDEGWASIVALCRRELKKAGAALHKALKSEDARLLELAKDPSTAKQSAAVRMQRMWRAMKGPRAAAALEAVWEGDNPSTQGEAERRMISYAEPGFKAELGKVGDAFVAQMADTPACVPAFEAWCEVFMEEFEPLKGLDGGEFDLVKELTWELFIEVLYSMPSGKAVGAGGFHAELLREAGEPAQRAFYRAMISDLQGQRIPAEWKTVLYALLIKKPPNRADVVSQRREIALMAHDMKLLLQMVRRVSYQRLTGRLLSAQAGWLTGFGCPDPGSVVAHVISQSANRRKALWLLYIDLATFFPRIDRDALTVAEALHGLPKQVRKLTLMIYGSAAEPDKAVTCHYDSAAGLGDGFQNWMGALMGCVLSPDKAKMLLNTIFVAIQAVCKGVRLWGYGDDDVANTWRAIVQAGFADDWCGMFASERDLQRAWRMWRVWEDISGSKLGVKNKLKTVVTGVQYVDGKARTVRDPLLRLRGGGFVPLMQCDEAYKHLGVWRRVDGRDTAMWPELRKLFMAALDRIRKMRRPSVNEFMQVTDALLGGLAEFYLQTFYITFEQAEEVERKWRGIYRLKFGGRLQEPDSKPRAYFYQLRGSGAYRRRHLWSIGLTAAVTCVNNAMADVDDTPQRAAMRSAVAMAMERWGCREDPNHWNWDYLATSIEQWLRRSASKPMGDVWMLATCLLEDEHRLQWAASEGTGRSGWARDFGGEQRAKWGRWRQEAPALDPLHRDARHWLAPRSTPINAPEEAGGLALPVETWLLHAGVTSVGHMCKRSVHASGAHTHAWQVDYKAARRQHPRLPDHGAAAKAWARQLEKLEGIGASPEEPETTNGGREDKLVWGPATASSAPDNESTAKTDAVDDAAVDKLLAALECTSARRHRSRSRWVEGIKRCVPQVQAAPATEWQHGGRDRGAEAVGARYVLLTDKARSAQAFGGEGRWGRRGSADYAPPPNDEVGLRTGADGWAAGHALATARTLAAYDIDTEGFLVDVRGERVQGEALGDLDPGLQLLARARIKLAEARPDAPVTDAPPLEKAKHTHVNLHVQRRNLRDLAEWQAKIKATAAYTLDGTRTRIPGDRASGRQPEFVVARAAARHDGVVKAARMHEVEGADNYLAEMAAQIDALNEENEGGRIIIVFDATSPVMAMHRFKRQCHRRRQGYYAGEWVEALYRLMNRQEVVVFLWQTSHVGSAINEWADVLAEGAAHDRDVWTAVPRLTPRSASMRFTMPRQSTHRWAAPLACGVVSRMLRRALGESEMHEEFDVAPLTLNDTTQSVCDAVLSQRSVMGDEKRHLGKARSELLGACACPFGCTDAQGNVVRFTWLHAQMFCGACELQGARRAWIEAGDAVDELLAVDGVPHDQVRSTMTMAKAGQQAQPARNRDVARVAERRARRLVGGLIRAPGDERLEKKASTRRALERFVTLGAKVQLVARELTRDIEEAAVQAAVDRARARKYGRRWLATTRAAGPARTAALRQVAEAVEMVSGAIVARAQDGSISTQTAEAQLHRLSAEGNKRHVVTGSATWSLIKLAREEWPRASAMGGAGGQWAEWPAACQERLLDGAWQWRLAALGQRWRLRARLKNRQMHTLADRWQERCRRGAAPNQLTTDRRQERDRRGSAPNQLMADGRQEQCRRDAAPNQLTERATAIKSRDLLPVTRRAARDRESLWNAARRAPTPESRLVSFKLTREMKMRVFEEYPEVEALFREQVPEKMTQACFWRRYFRSKSRLSNVKEPRGGRRRRDEDHVRRRQVPPPRAHDTATPTRAAEGASLLADLATELNWMVTGRDAEFTAQTTSVEDVIAEECAASKKWRDSGGWPALRRKWAIIAEGHRRAADTREQQRTVRQGARFKAYMQQTGAAEAGLSGTRMGDATGERISLEIAPRRTRRKRGPQRTGAQRGSVQQQLFEQGAGKDRYGRHKVERALEVRRTRCSARLAGAYRLQVRLRWVGTCPRTGAAWPDSWHDVYEGEGKRRRCALNALLMADVKHMDAIKYGTIIAPRQARMQKRARDSTEASQAAAPTAGRRAKWHKALRSSAGTSYAAARTATRPGGAHRIVESDDEEGGCNADPPEERAAAALADIRRRRRLKPRAPRRSVLVSDSDSD